MEVFLCLINQLRLVKNTKEKTLRVPKILEVSATEERLVCFSIPQSHYLGRFL